MAKANANTKETLNKNNRQQAAKDDFEDDFESVEFNFPPIAYFVDEGDTVTFIPLGIDEGPKGLLLKAQYINSTGNVHFEQKRSTVEVNEGDVVSIGLCPAIMGELKLGMENGEFGKLGEYCAERKLPVRLIYHGKVKSETNRGRSYHSFEIMAKKGVMEAIQN